MDFASEVLEKPSTATDMNQLILEFNTIQLLSTTNISPKDDQEMQETDQIDVLFKFKDYFKFWRNIN